jgi:hypothetical protein
MISLSTRMAARLTTHTAGLSRPLPCVTSRNVAAKLSTLLHSTIQKRRHQKYSIGCTAEGTWTRVPAGTLASVMAAASSSAVSGVSSDGLSTTAQPAASAGAIFHL